VEAGVFLVFEGTEGSGKSTQARLLGERLREAGNEVVLTREPGGTAIGEQIRRIVLGPDNCAMLAETEALLYAASRAQHVGDVLRPAIAAGQVVVCDRFVDSSLAYQGGGRGLPSDELLAVQRLATGALRPDLRLLLDVPVGVGLGRRFAEADAVNRFDTAEVAFHERVRDAYHALVRAHPAEWAVIDAVGSIESVARRVDEAVSVRLGARLASLRGPASGGASSAGTR
jgi:dTMP kinase